MRCDDPRWCALAGNNGGSFCEHLSDISLTFRDSLNLDRGCLDDPLNSIKPLKRRVFAVIALVGHEPLCPQPYRTDGEHKRGHAEQHERYV